MGTLTMKPESVFRNPGGWVATGGTLTPVVSDDSDLTYVHGPANREYLWFRLSNVSIPAGARIDRIYPRARARRIGLNTSNRITVNLGGLNSEGSFREGFRPSLINPNTAASWKTGKAYYAYVHSPNNVVEITQARLDSLYIGAYEGGIAETRLYELECVAIYDEAPIATYIGPTGSVLNTNTPTISWEYSDDYHPQIQYRVQIRNTATNAIVYDTDNASLGGTPDAASGINTTKTADTFHRLNEALPQGSYEARVKVRQLWESLGDGRPGGEFWGPWTMWADGAFTMAAIPLSAPEIEAVDADNHILVTTAHRLNLLPYDVAHNEESANAWFDIVNCTTAPINTDSYDGDWCLEATITASSVQASVSHDFRRVQVDAGEDYYAKAMVSGSQAGSAQLVVDFYNESGALLSTTSGALIAISGWTKLTVDLANAPLNSTFARLRVVWPTVNAVAADQWQIDAAYFGPLALDSDSIDLSLGGMFEESLNVLTVDDAEITASHHYEGTLTAVTTIANPDGGNDTVLRLEKTSGSAGVTADLAGDRKYIPTEPGEQWVTAAYAKRVAGDAATAALNVRWFDENLATISTVGTGNAAVTSGKWVRAGINASGPIIATAPDGAAYLQLRLTSNICAVGTVILWNDIAIYKAGIGRGFQPGITEQKGPYVVVEYSEDAGSRWKELNTQDAVLPFSDEQGVTPGLLDFLNGTEVQDYDAASQTPRSYRAYSWKLKDGVVYKSDYSEVTDAIALNLLNVWIHAVDNPENTIHYFRYDGHGRSEVPDTAPSKLSFAGRPYPLAEFGQVGTREISVVLKAPDLTDQTALLAFANYRGMVVFRDQPGRRVRGILTGWSFTDEVWGQTITFKVEAIGVQPWFEGE